MKAFFLLALLATSAFADIYMLNPRGSNDRLNEENENRNNANRLFDSQNNAKGGFCVGPQMAFYEGSLLSVEWTNQHGCGNPNLYCNVVIQYMCGSSSDPDNLKIRDGTTTNTIPDTDAGPTQRDNNGNLQFGMHEPRSNYRACATRQRNLGLFIADRASEGGLNDNQAAVVTRQNNNANRHGYECAEERDYYPYWHPSPWRDIAILADDERHCDTYKSESQNVKEKFQCLAADGGFVAPNNEADCRSEDPTYQWVSTPAHGIAAPVCIKAAWNRQNYLGNDFTGEGTSFNWTMPTSSEVAAIATNTAQCVLRLRYNISTNDISVGGGNAPGGSFIDWKYNGAASPVQDDTFVTQNGNIFQLAMDTTQFGRTFEDRTHTFTIIPRPSGVSALNRIFNINVRGKRGNIVQAFPAVEYDFAPNFIATRVGDYVHFQWTGCDQNPAGNAGEGTDQTDRSNVVQLQNYGDDYPASDEWLESNPGKAMLESRELRTYFAGLGIDFSTCPTQAQLLARNNNNENQAKQDVGNCFKLNNASPYFNGGLLRTNKTGTYHYMSTRNNSFTNRTQKATWVVDTLIPVWGIVLVVVGGVACVGSAGVAGAVYYSKANPHAAPAWLRG